MVLHLAGRGGVTISPELRRRIAAKMAKMERLSPKLIEARVVLARVMRKVLGDIYRADLSGFADTEIIDVAHYHVFPNMMLLPGLTLPAVYRFRPIGNDPDRTLFEILILREAPDSGARPEPAEPVRLTEAQSYGEVPGYDPFLAEIYDQDTNNLRAQQEGFKTARKPGQTLLNYQEIRVRLLHQTLDGYLGGSVPLDFAPARTGSR